LELLVRKAGKKKKKNRDVLCYKEKELDLYLERVNKNWRTRRKKPPDKIVEVMISSLSVKEFNKKRSVTKFWKQYWKNNEVKPGQDRRNLLKNYFCIGCTKSRIGS
jgi:sugar diacid utilization regulator